MRCRASYYQQFDADYTLAVPAHGYGGWQTTIVDLEPAATAVVSMHAWDCGRFEDFPGVWRSVEYIPRSHAIAETVFPPLFAAIRAAGVPLLHVTSGGGAYYHDLPGYRRTVELAGPSPDPGPSLTPHASTAGLWQLRSDRSWRGTHNWEDASRFLNDVDFLPAARPADGEWIAEDSWQLAAICRHLGIDHLIYTGFAVDACLLSSPGGMVDLCRAGALCSVVRDATTAIESKESAADELHKQAALWRIGSQFGLVFDAADLIEAMGGRADG